MRRRLLRAVFVTGTALMLSQVPVAAPANAGGSCGNGTPFVQTTAGQLDWYEYQDWYRTDSVGPTTVQVDGSEYYGAYLEVYDSSCTYLLCSTAWNHSMSCTLDYIGTINVVYGNYYGYPSTYTLSDQRIDQPGVVVDVPLATARVCRADYTVTVAAIGLEEFPAYSIC